MKNHERVMVVPNTEIVTHLNCNGLTPHCDGIIHKILYRRIIKFIDRDEAEKSLQVYLQVIPYVIFTCSDRVFTYVRGKKSSEERLRGNRAVGIGGHINEDDAIGYPFHHDYFYNAYLRGMRREIREEVSIDGPYTDEVGGIIYTDKTEVGAVHVGIMHHVELEKESMIRPNGYEITDSKFMSVDELLNFPDLVDDWTTICIPHLVDSLGKYIH